ncbi:hypothetical protein H477_2810 [[Clostridium] sordellii ATCC 9714]|nr:hypothetical protein H477_2810 [[Clostridium] sordellii ATCC 9714] [Paeniclostridium sordellii ATCC 9714]
MGKTNQFLIDDIIETTNKSKKKCSKSKPRNGLKYKKEDKVLKYEDFIFFFN